jgi:hypothetical protein
MAHLIDNNLVERANNALLLGILWAALHGILSRLAGYYCLEKKDAIPRFHR